MTNDPPPLLTLKPMASYVGCGECRESPGSPRRLTDTSLRLSKNDVTIRLRSSRIRHSSFLIRHCLLLLVLGCSGNATDPVNDPLFVLLSPEQSGVDFVNSVTTDDTINILTYEYLYNGGGVGVGDFNNDGFQDVFFAGSQVPGKLYINKGRAGDNTTGFAFEDVTATAGITRDENWIFGVSVIDINQDGWQDIYLSIGGPGNLNAFPNKLFVHQGLDDSGRPSFREMAAQYGLADRGQSIQALFFDYDRDGDLDMYQLTGGGFERSPNNPSPIISDGNAVNTDRLYRNDPDEQKGHPFFTDVSREAGILHEGYGLGIGMIDINEDGWQDIYVTNDYLTNDHLYLNNRDGTFSDKIHQYFKHTSHFAMGNDIGDLNNDGLMDVVALDMLPDGHYRRKLMFGATQYNKFYYAVNHGYTHQYMRNTLQINNGNGSFSEVGQMAGIYKTDWSWAVLLADLDNDELQDIFITNGFGKDVTDLDFVKFRSNITSDVSNAALRRKILLDSLAQRPGIKVSNYCFRNTGKAMFSDVSTTWGFDSPAYSNGAAYADFDNDGDLDLVVSNIDDVAFVYRNMHREKFPSANYLRVRLTGSPHNRSAIGSKVTLRYDGKIQSKTKAVVRGFQSTVEDIIHFGLGSTKEIDTLEVTWPDGKVSLMTGVSANQLIHINDSAARAPQERAVALSPPSFAEITRDIISHKHEENPFVDFNHEPLLPHKLSQEGPGMAVGDVNGDGLEDLFIGGALLKAGKIFLQKTDGTFAGRDLGPAELETEDLGALFFDADNDNDLDLYVVSGGNEYNPDHRHYQDRLYFNDGRGNFVKAPAALPRIGSSGSCVTGADYDHDGDIDLFVGGRVLPTAYPTAPRSYLLRNDGKGNFQDVTADVCPPLQAPGMVTSALWTDFDNDTWVDLVVVGEFMPVSFYRNNNGQAFVPLQTDGLTDSEGWWNSITAGDFDNDGDMDYIAGNFGLNTHYTATRERPISVSYKDFDNNGAIEAILSYYEEGENFPAASLDVLTSQLPSLKRKILFYRTYARTTTNDLLEIAGGIESNILYCRTLESAYVENSGNGSFRLTALPFEMQIAPVYGVITDDVNGDGNLDFVAVGNSYAPDVVSGRCDASIGHVMLGDGAGQFTAMRAAHSGFFVDGDAKGMVEIARKGDKVIMISQNNDSLKAFSTISGGRRPIVALEGSEVKAVLTMSNGQRRIVEVGYGTTYLSQSSRSIGITPGVVKIELFDMTGARTRAIEFGTEPNS